MERYNLDILFNTPEKRRGACEKVRALVTDFDAVPLSPDVEHYGEPGTTESRQYYLLDGNERSFYPYDDLIQLGLGELDLLGYVHSSIRCWWILSHLSHLLSPPIQRQKDRPALHQSGREQNGLKSLHRRKSMTHLSH